MIDVRRPLQTLALYSFHILFARPILRWVAGVRYRRRNLVPQGPCLVVSNHNSHLDAAVLMTMFPLSRLRRVHPVAAADYFGSNWFMRTVAMLFMNGIPIERRPSRGEDPLVPIADLLKAGETLIFFPEGSRGEAGVVAKFRPGVGRLVQEVPGLLVVPVFLAGPERIWPRGELVPVPLNVDAHIGRPRTYPALEDPRDIADRVREDVLSLAPHPPPVPGERPLPPLRVAVCGVDDEAVGEVFRRVTARLGRSGPTLGVAGIVLEADGAGVREATGPVPVGWRRAWLSLLAALLRVGPRFRGQRFIDLIERAQINEALGQGRHTRFVVEEGSALVDLMASARASERLPEELPESRHLLDYLTGERKAPLRRTWRLIRAAPEVWLINALSLTRLTVPEVLVHLTQPAAGVMRRLRSAGGHLLPHQNESGLERLQEAYRDVGELLRRRRRAEVLEIDAESVAPEAAAQQVEARCLALAGERCKVAPGP